MAKKCPPYCMKEGFGPRLEQFLNKSAPVPNENENLGQEQVHDE